MLVELVRRAVSHPHTATFVKRAVAIQHGEGDAVEVPTWGVVVVYLTFVVGMLGFSLVSTPCCIFSLARSHRRHLVLTFVLLVVVHAQPRRGLPVHG